MLKIRILSLAALSLSIGIAAFGQPAATDSVIPSAAPAPEPFNEERILGVIPDYQTVTETRATGTAAPLTAKQKWNLALRETIDPFNLANAMVGAGFSQIGNQTPKYGEGVPAFGMRFGAALADFGTQNFFSAGVFATLLHQDPRYFRKGPEAKIPARVLYSISRIFVARQDSGRSAFNASGIFGMAAGIAASNLYYPAASVRGRVMAGRFETSLFGDVTGNLMSEFWPDVQRKFFHRKHNTLTASTK
jgi:hypothetical protein